MTTPVQLEFDFMRKPPRDIFLGLAFGPALATARWSLGIVVERPLKNDERR